MNEFHASLIAACHTCVASSLHAIGIPSLLSRVIDIVSIIAQSLLTIVQIYTTCQGELSWALFGCPCLERTEGFRQEGNCSSRAVPEVAVGTQAVDGSTPKRIFGFHSAHQLIKAVHEVEGAYRLGRDDPAYRQIVTVGDQAILGTDRCVSHERNVLWTGSHPTPSRKVCVQVPRH